MSEVTFGSLACNQVCEGGGVSLPRALLLPTELFSAKASGEVIYRGLDERDVAGGPG